MMPPQGYPLPLHHMFGLLLNVESGLRQVPQSRTNEFIMPDQKGTICITISKSLKGVYCILSAVINVFQADKNTFNSNSYSVNLLISWTTMSEHASHVRPCLGPRKYQIICPPPAKGLTRYNFQEKSEWRWSEIT